MNGCEHRHRDVGERMAQTTMQSQSIHGEVVSRRPPADCHSLRNRDRTESGPCKLSSLGRNDPESNGPVDNLDWLLLWHGKIAIAPGGLLFCSLTAVKSRKKLKRGKQNKNLIKKYFDVAPTADGDRYTGCRGIAPRQRNRTYAWRYKHKWICSSNQSNIIA